MGEELDDLDRTHVIGVSDPVMMDVPPDPADVGLFGSQGIVPKAKRDSHAVEKLGGPPGLRLARGVVSPGPRGTSIVAPGGEEFR
jgi:hypothetical protein